MAKPKDPQEETQMTIASSDDLANVDLTTLSLVDILALGQQTEAVQQDEQKQGPAWKPVLPWQLTTLHSENKNIHIPQSAKGGSHIMLERACTDEELTERKAKAASGVEVDERVRLYAEFLPYVPMGKIQATIIGGTPTGKDKKTTAQVAYVKAPGDEEAKLACSTSSGIYPNSKYIGNKVWEERLSQYINIGFNPNTGKALQDEQGEPLPICPLCPLAQWELNGATGSGCSKQPDYVIYIPPTDLVFTLEEVGSKKKRLVESPAHFPGGFVQIRLRTSGMKAAVAPWQQEYLDLGKKEKMISALHLFEAAPDGTSSITPDGRPVSGEEQRINQAYIYPVTRTVKIKAGPQAGQETNQYVIQFELGAEINKDLDEDSQLHEAMTLEEYAEFYMLPVLRYRQENIAAQFLRLDETLAGVKNAFVVQAPSFSVEKVTDMEEDDLFDDDDEDEDVLVDLSQQS